MLSCFTPTSWSLCYGICTPWVLVWENSGCSCQLSPCWESFFSNSGLIIRPHRAKMSDKLLKSFVFSNIGGGYQGLGGGGVISSQVWLSSEMSNCTLMFSLIGCANWCTLLRYTCDFLSPPPAYSLFLLYHVVVNKDDKINLNDDRPILSVAKCNAVLWKFEGGYSRITLNSHFVLNWRVENENQVSATFRVLRKRRLQFRTCLPL